MSQKPKKLQVHWNIKLNTINIANFEIMKFQKSKVMFIKETENGSIAEEKNVMSIPKA